MKNKLLTSALLIVIAITLIFTGCDDNQPTDEFVLKVEDIADYSIEIISKDITYIFEKANFSDYTLMDITTKTTKNDKQITDEWKGISLSSILNKAGIDNTVSKIKCSASDYHSTITVDDIDTYYIALYRKEDNKFEALSLEKFRIISTADEFQSNWVKSLTSIEINPISLSKPSNFSIDIVFEEKTYNFSNENIKSFDIVDFSTSTTKNDITTTTNYKGVKLADILNAAEIDVTVNSINFIDLESDYNKTYDSDINIDNFYIALYEEEEGTYTALETEKIKNVCTTDTFSSGWVKGLDTVTINPT